jgi:ABC-type glycerol-3-phosphate transport system permease component
LLLFFGWVIWSLMLLVPTISEMLGFLDRWIALLVGTLLFPVVFILAPFYALVAHGDWTVLAKYYGGVVLLVAVGTLATRVARDDSEK